MVAGVFAVNIYRATHQSITADEAFTYDLYIQNSFQRIFTTYDANNHVIHTLLCRLSVRTLGLSELTMRLPSLAGGLLYLIFSYKLCRHLFSNLWTFFLALAVLTLNPFIMDYLSVARGYGMAVGLFTAALYLVIRFFDAGAGTTGARMTLAFSLLGLSMAANLVFVFPAVALAGALTLLRLIEQEPAGGGSRKAPWIIGRVWLPLACPVVVFLTVPLAHATKDAFYYGKDSLLETILSVVAPSFFHQQDLGNVSTIPANIVWSIEIIARWVVPLLVLLALGMAIPICLRWRKARDFRRLSTMDRGYVLITAVLGFSLGMLIAAHGLAGMLYPIDRTAIYLVALLTLESMLLIEYAIHALRIHRAVGLLASAPAVLALFFFLRGFTTSYYYEWRFDAGTRQIFRLLEERHAFSSGQPIRVGADWRLDFSLNFYRQMYHAGWLAKLTSDPPPETGGFDYYVLLPDEGQLVRKLGLHVIYRDLISTQEVAAPDRYTRLLGGTFSDRSRLEPSRLKH
jgi:hypothetical protein